MDKKEIESIALGLTVRQAEINPAFSKFYFFRVLEEDGKQTVITDGLEINDKRINVITIHGKIAQVLGVY